MKMRDLHTYVAPERAPTHVNYRGLDVYSMGPPSSGGSTVGEALNILEGYPLSSMTRESTRCTTILEASRYSFADRNAYLADPAYFDVPLTGLLSKDYAATRRALITTTAAPGAVPPGNPYPYNTGEAAATALQSGDDDAPRRRRTSGATSSRTRSRSSRPAARASSCRASGSCSTTS